MVCVVFFFCHYKEPTSYSNRVVSTAIKTEHTSKEKNLLGEKFTEGEGLTPNTPGYS